MNNNAIKRVAIYAAWDKKGKVDNADISYLSALKNCAERIIYVADCNLAEKEKRKLKDICCYVEGTHHGEYDFGSYKKGFFYALRHHLLEGTEELVFANDSCFASFHPFSPIFEEMSHKQCDFWGLTLNMDFYPHVQSFFLVFRPQVFNSQIFIDFMQKIEAQKSVDGVIHKYEIGLTQYLEENGFCKKTYIPYPYHNKLKRSNLTECPIWLINQGFPLLKKKALKFTGANSEGVLKTYLFARRYIKRDMNFWDVVGAYVKVFLHFLYQKKITKHGRLMIKICKIPVCVKRVDEK